MAQAARSRQARTRLALPVQRDCRGRQIRMSCASSPGKGEIPAQDRGEVPGLGVLLDRSEGVLLGAAVHVHGVAWRAMCPELGRGWRVGIRVEGAKGARDVARTAHALRADHVVRAAARAAILAACGEERGHLSLRCCGVSQRKRRRVRTPRARRGGRRSGLSQRLQTHARIGMSRNDQTCAKRLNCGLFLRRSSTARMVCPSPPLSPQHCLGECAGLGWEKYNDAVACLHNADRRTLISDCVRFAGIREFAD